MNEVTGQTKEITTDEPLNWDAKMVNGILTIIPICEEIPNEKGGVDVILKMPSLSLINKFKAANSIQ